MTRETVAMETLALLATSCIVDNRYTPLNDGKRLHGEYSYGVDNVKKETDFFLDKEIRNP